MQSLAKDPSPQVRRECAIALRFQKTPAAAALWADLAAQHDGKDRWYLEALGIGAALNEDACFDAWAKKGWIDLRPANLGTWRARVAKMLSARASLRAEGSAAASIHSFMATGFEIGEVVAWIFNNEMGGYRVK